MQFWATENTNMWLQGRKDDQVGLYLFAVYLGLDVRLCDRLTESVGRKRAEDLHRASNVA